MLGEPVISKVVLWRYWTLSGNVVVLTLSVLVPLTIMTDFGIPRVALSDSGSRRREPATPLFADGGTNRPARHGSALGAARPGRGGSEPLGRAERGGPTTAGQGGRVDSNASRAAGREIRRSARVYRTVDVKSGANDAQEGHQVDTSCGKSVLIRG